MIKKITWIYDKKITNKYCYRNALENQTINDRILLLKNVKLLTLYVNCLISYFNKLLNNFNKIYIDLF